MYSASLDVTRKGFYVQFSGLCSLQSCINTADVMGCVFMSTIFWQLMEHSLSLTKSLEFDNSFEMLSNKMS